MRLETLLPLGKVDPGLRASEAPLDIFKVASDARLIEALGYSGLVVEETKDDPFVLLALAAQATTTLKLGTAVSIAFPRSPTVTAMSAWTLQKLSRGRFSLGLGPQVRGHMERRYGVKWSAPGPWMGEYVAAVRAVWDCWQNGAPLAFEGAHYQLSLMVPLFDPGPIEHPEIPIHLAAVGPVMCRVAGEVADGLRPHPVCTPSYIEEIMLPAARAGAVKAGRSLADFQVSMKPLVATAATAEQLAARIGDARARIAFYASTPAYGAAFAHLGLADLAAECKALAQDQRWEELPPRISDDVLRQFVVIGTHDEIAARLRDRFGGLVTDIEFSIAVTDEADKARLAAIVGELQADDPGPARQAILGEGAPASPVSRRPDASARAR